MMGEETAKKLHAMGITKVSIICQDAISMDKSQFEAKYAHAWTKHHAVADYFARAVENPERLAELKRRLSAAAPAPAPAPAPVKHPPIACAADIQKTQSGIVGTVWRTPFFTFTKSYTHVIFPYGITMYTDALVGPGLQCTVAYLNFQYIGGNIRWAVGVVPESQSGDTMYLWKTTGAIGRHNCPVDMPHDCALPQLSMPANQTITTAVDAVRGKWYLAVPGKPLVVQDVPPSHFPLRLAICGHMDVTMHLVGGALPAEMQRLLN
jgi:hypothetical protein